MSWGTLLSITVLVILMIAYEWPKMKQYSTREKGAFIVLTLFGYVLGVLLIFFPEMPGPTQLVDAVFKPLGKMLE
ncbi:hypothetical protein SK3146_05791 [Paenibacillus konkukensis]|uniref:Uncharacterized protein n=1 Tax=Paenibacillus konkukensis TaxID=2020716 RepID=A0ABY4RWX1_9BACL|nr:hypothetical protein [Paenibacillus konkukensis]UQZ86498.1 hypothetical protein SK3146_05791 [Paenibacillus konkukensis]